jgi:hypothetical protein
MLRFTEAEKAEFVAAMREEILSDDRLIDRLSEKLQARGGKPPLLSRPFELMARRKVIGLQVMTDGEAPVSNWSISLLAGIIGMACASDSGGLNEGQGFALGFTTIFLGMIILEMFANRRNRRE